eukprot:522109_1
MASGIATQTPFQTETFSELSVRYERHPVKQKSDQYFSFWFVWNVQNHKARTIAVYDQGKRQYRHPQKHAANTVSHSNAIEGEEYDECQCGEWC